MTPAPLPHEPLHHFEIVDEESLHLLVAARELEDGISKPRYCSFDDTFSTSIMSSSGELSDEDVLSQGITSPSCGIISRSCFQTIWNAYYDSLQRHPIIVKSVTAFVLLLLADLMAQGVEHSRGLSQIQNSDPMLATTPSTAPIDWLRTLRFGVFGLLGAPWTHYYYYWLDTLLPPTEQPWTCTTFAKVTVDQGIQAPVMLALIISGLAFMEGRGWKGISHDMQQQYAEALIQNWKLWIPATILNIAFVKPALRVLYDNLIFFVWTIYLSIILNEDSDDSK